MSGGPLITVEELAGLRAGEPHCLALLDVRWALGGPPGRPEYVQGHIPGAVFVDLDTELAAPPGAGGRHPLPDVAAFTAAMRTAGVHGAEPVVVYDAASSMSAARAWWLLRYFGHPDVAVLDGGLAAWMAAGYDVEVGEPLAPPPGDFVARPGGMPLVDAAGAASIARRGVLLDARAPERFRGEREPIDPVAGHIPGARSHPATENVDADGRFLDRHALRDALERDGIGERTEIGAYCGSGVSAAHEVLAVELAGYRAALYAGSWSEWITDPRRPVARG